MSISKNIPPRIVIYPCDVMKITHRGLRFAQQLLQKIRIAFGKEKFQFVTVDEFSFYTGIDPDEVRDILKD